MKEGSASPLSIPGNPPDGAFAYLLRLLLTGLAWVAFGIGGLCLSLAFRALPLSLRDRGARIRFARRTVSASFRLFAGFLRAARVADIDASGVRCLRRSRGVIIAANHPTLLDYVFIASELPEVDCLVKAELSRNFFLKGIVKSAGYMLNSEFAPELIGEARERLAQGDSILIFPEGTRTRPGERMPLRRGAAQMALRSGATIRLVHIKCSEFWLTKGAPWYRIPAARPVIRIEEAGALRPRDFWNSDEAKLPAAARAMTAALAESLAPGGDAESHKKREKHTKWKPLKTS